MPTAFSSLDPVRQDLAFKRAAEHVQKVKASVPVAMQSIMDEITRRKKRNALKTGVPPIFKDFYTPARYKGAHGGRGSAKSQTFGRMLLDHCIDNPGTRAVCIREVQKSLEQSVKRLLEDLIELHGLGKHFRILNTHIETPGGGIIIFQGMQNHTADSIKSLEGFDIAWVEEAQSLSERSLTLLRPTIRKEGSEIWFTWNPNKPTDPVDVLLRGETTPQGTIVRKVNYHDNPFMPLVLQREMEWDRGRDIEKYNHVWLGGYERKSEARVFKNWRVEDFETPSDSDFLYGGDWGFSTDPTVGIRAFIKPHEPTNLYVDAEVYKVGCEIDDTPSLYDQLGCTLKHEHGIEGPCEGLAREWEIIADSARPETISYMKRHGYSRIVGARKGPGSIEEGIQFLKTYDIIVHPRCKHVIDELTYFCFKTHPLTGEIMPVLAQKKNHTIDSLRYTVEKLRRDVADDWVVA